MIHVEEISKSYQRGTDTVQALHATTFDVQPGEFVAVIGPSGSGKSTLLSMLGGMLSPTAGRIILDGDSIYELNVEQRAELRNRKIGFVFQNFNLIPWLNALENVEIPLRMYGGDRSSRRNTATKLLEQFELTDRLTHRPGELSAGQQQRVALARMLATDPKLILADEPTGNLDSETRDLVVKTLAQQCGEGRTVILVTHDEAVSATASRVLHIADGVVTDQKNSEEPTGQVAVA